MRGRSWRAVALIAAWLPSLTIAAAAGAAEPAPGACPGASALPHSTGVALARDYLVEKLCVTPAGSALSVDPCDCAAPNRLRNYAPGDALPYHKVDQSGAQRHDSLVSTAVDGREIFEEPFDFTPFDQFDLWGDGYDVYELRDGWAFASQTRDGGGFSTTFFGERCQLNGWVFFPVAALRDGGIEAGEVTWPIAARYWEQNGEPWPGTCPAAYNRDSLTSWTTLRGFPFGNRDGSRRKSIDTIQVVHGLSSRPSFQEHGHLEVFYFTRLYGVTRWEVWVPGSELPANETRIDCSGDSRIQYRGAAYVRTACRDWSAITVLTPPQRPASWPLPDRNLLRNFHFADGLQHWSRAGTSVGGAPMHWETRVSTAERDRHFRQAQGVGLRYLAIDCAGECADGEALYQDIPMPAGADGRVLGFGASLRSESGDGSVRLRLVQLDATGHELASLEFEATIPDRSARRTGAESIYGASTFVSRSEALVVDPAARTLRFMLSPRSRQTFDVLDAWVIR